MRPAFRLCRYARDQCACAVACAVMPDLRRSQNAVALLIAGHKMRPSLLLRLRRLRCALQCAKPGDGRLIRPARFPARIPISKLPSGHAKAFAKFAVQLPQLCAVRAHRVGISRVIRTIATQFEFQRAHLFENPHCVGGNKQFIRRRLLVDVGTLCRAALGAHNTLVTGGTANNSIAPARNKPPTTARTLEPVFEPIRRRQMRYSVRSGTRSPQSHDDAP
jgi:hypothetical protein